MPWKGLNSINRDLKSLTPSYVGENRVNGNDKDTVGKPACYCKYGVASHTSIVGRDSNGQ